MSGHTSSALVRSWPPTRQRRTPLELFFDLVFVYALTQVTTLLRHGHLPATGFARGLVVLTLVGGPGRLLLVGNVAQVDEGLLRLAFIAVMMAMFVMALAIPESFDDLAGGVGT